MYYCLAAMTHEAPPKYKEKVTKLSDLPLYPTTEASVVGYRNNK